MPADINFEILVNRTAQIQSSYLDFEFANALFSS